MRALILTLFFLLCAIVTVAQPEPSDDENWLKFTSEHFEMLSSASERGSMHALVQLEQFREFVLRTIPHMRDSACEPKPLIFIFNSHQQRSRLLFKNPDAGARQAATPYLEGRLRPRIMITVNRGRLPVHISYHGYACSLINARLGPDVPLWLEEGLAGVFETLSANGDTVTFGRTNAIRLQTISRPPLIPLDTLFTANRNSPHYKENDRTGKFRSQAWLLLHYAMLGENSESCTLENLLRFADESSRPGAITSEVFEKVFGFDYKTLEDALDSYLRAGAYEKSTARIPTSPIRNKITSLAVTDEEFELERAGLSWRVNKAPDAMAALRELEKEHPENPRVYELLAEMQTGKRDNQAAANYLAKAVEKNTANPMTYIELIGTLIDQGKPGRLVPEKTAAECKALVDRAIELAPDCMEAYEMLAIIESQSPVMRVEKTRPIMEALPRMRERGKTRVALATIYWRLKRHDEAQAMLNETMGDTKSSDDMKRLAHELQRRIAKETGAPAPAPLPKSKQAPPKPAPMEPGTKERWLKLSSEHFDIFTSAHEYASLQLLIQLEQFREFFFRTIPQGRIYDPKPLIFIFDDNEHYERYRPDGPDRKAHTPPGKYFGGHLQSRIMMRHAGRFGQRLIIHEYIHSLISTRMGPRVPLWFSEGMAGVYETASIRGDTVTFGRVEEMRLKTITRTPPLPLGTLFNVGYRSPYYQGGGPETAKFYALSWLLLHYAMLGKNNEPYTVPNLMRFAAETSPPRGDTAKAFEKVFGSDYKGLEQALNSYMRAGEYVATTTTIPADPIRNKITTRLADDEEIEIELAGLAWRAGMTPTTVSLEALDVMFKLEKKYPENPRVYEILAEAQMRMNDAKTAAHYKAKAIKKNAANPKVYVELLKYDDIKPDKPGRLMSARAAAKYAALADRAIELAPDYMEAYEMLAIIESQNPNIRVEKMNAVLEALPHMRERDKTHYALATVYWRLKRHEEAQAVINELKNDPKSSDAMKRRASELQRLIEKEAGKKASAKNRQR
ncbi:tetratricopeptide repeat protein [Ereboglobus luteus]|nr:tetratricopeptide repeat protein [Ereboglobus luteus]